MKIAQVAPVFRGVSHAHTKNVHRSLHDLTEALIYRGHEVRVITGFEPPLGDFDVIHYHVEHPRELEYGVGRPDLCTIYGSVQGAVEPMDCYGVRWVATSQKQLDENLDLGWSGLIHRGLPEQLYQPAMRRGSYLVHLCTGGSDEDRLAFKRVRQLSLTTRIPLIVGLESGISDTRVPWLHEEQESVEVRRITRATREPLLQQALALVLPTDGDLPGDIAALEAMACGTPVVAWQGGTAAELIDNGRTGFIVESGAQAGRALNGIMLLDRRTISDTFETQLSSEVTATNYLELYREVVAEKELRGSSGGDSRAA